MKLKEIVHSRTGDKGNFSNVSVIVYEMGDYEKVKKSITAERVKKFFQEIVKGDVIDMKSLRSVL
ncbi:hypothetical protein [Fictibacillus sp. KU28468]|uniref:AtuA-related protein n=1 Tax=Fictibacillus sp. KU28468 TaxID=2991053 RepID=UPI00223DABF9|nr:hypothetical protein [Fictibacillus sp. KU28468]UZJ80972.1 hypothetical protein OKX00_11270 [Fictibacillus sp. KU28468]